MNPFSSNSDIPQKYERRRLHKAWFQMRYPSGKLDEIPYDIWTIRVLSRARN